jgi:hypothetical protein
MIPFVPSLPLFLAALVIFVTVPLNWMVVTRQWRLLRRHPDNRVLRERFLLAVVLTAVISVFAIVFVNNNLAQPILSPVQTMIVTRTAMLALSLPALYWLSLYRGRR